MSEKKCKLLIVEDDRVLQRQLAWTFDDFEVLSASNRSEAIKQVHSADPPVVTLDLGLPPEPNSPKEGLAILEQIRSLNPNIKVIVLTGNDDRANALKAISLGAYDFCHKPIDGDTIRLVVERAYSLFTLESEIRRLNQLQQKSSLPGLVTCSPTMIEACKMAEKVAPTSVSVFLTGESGVGKELVARALHELSPRAGGPFVAINCAAIPENLLESELFGHEKGAFTGAYRQVIGKIQMADRGSLFLDEIGDMPLPLQAKLLRFLQNRIFERVGGRQEISVDIRVISATHQRRDELIKTGRLREDLFYRLSELIIDIPPLRERPGDPELLAHHFLNVMTRQFNRFVEGFTPDATAAIRAYHWPGNVRELENRMKRAVIMAEGKYITPADLNLAVEAATSGRSLREARDQADREALQEALVRANGNISKAAKLLDISRPTLYDLLRQHNIRT